MLWAIFRALKKSPMDKKMVTLILNTDISVMTNSVTLIQYQVINFVSAEEYLQSPK